MIRYIIIASFFCLAATCVKTPDCGYNYAFIFPVSVTAQDTFSLGDTIWYELDISNNILDNKTGEYIDFTNFELYFELDISRLDTNFNIFVPHWFDYYVEEGEINQSTSGPFLITFFYTKSIQEKGFKIGVIPRYRGTFLSQTTLPRRYLSIEMDRYDRLAVTDTECDEYIYDESRVSINNDSSNYHHVNDLCQIGSTGSNICYTYQTMQQGGFAFHVKD
jgi:hypothetical protein